jgi:hypothetical protein
MVTVNGTEERACIYGGPNLYDPVAQDIHELALAAEAEWWAQNQNQQTDNTQQAGVKAPPNGPPPIPLPPGPKGEPNEWVKVPGTDSDKYGPKWEPKFKPEGQSPPRAWWDPHDGWWSHETGRGDPRGHFDRWGNKINLGDKPSIMDRLRKIPPTPIAEAGAVAVIIYVIVSEGSRFVFPLRNAIPLP